MFVFLLASIFPVYGDEQRSAVDTNSLYGLIHLEKILSESSKNFCPIEVGPYGRPRSNDHICNDPFSAICGPDHITTILSRLDEMRKFEKTFEINSVVKKKTKIWPNRSGKYAQYAIELEKALRKKIGNLDKALDPIKKAYYEIIEADRNMSMEEKFRAIAKIKGARLVGAKEWIDKYGADSYRNNCAGFPMPSVRHDTGEVILCSGAMVSALSTNRNLSPDQAFSRYMRFAAGHEIGHLFLDSIRGTPKEKELRSCIRKEFGSVNEIKFTEISSDILGFEATMRTLPQFSYLKQETKEDPRLGIFKDYFGSSFLEYFCSKGEEEMDNYLSAKTRINKILGRNWRFREFFGCRPLSKHERGCSPYR